MSDDKLPSRADYDAASPRGKGFMAYWYSSWPGSEIPSEAVCPFEKGTAEHEEFAAGVQSAIIAAIDSEE